MRTFFWRASFQVLWPCLCGVVGTRSNETRIDPWLRTGLSTKLIIVKIAIATNTPSHARVHGPHDEKSFLVANVCGRLQSNHHQDGLLLERERRRLHRNTRQLLCEHAISRQKQPSQSHRFMCTAPSPTQCCTSFKWCPRSAPFTKDKMETLALLQRVSEGNCALHASVDLCTCLSSCRNTARLPVGLEGERGHEPNFGAETFVAQFYVSAKGDRAVSAQQSWPNTNG